MTDYRETKQHLMTVMRLAFVSELRNTKADELYDRDFILRVGLRCSQLGRATVKCFVVMILLDMLILLLISGKGSEIEILNNKLSVIPGSIEIGLILSSFIYVIHIIFFMESYFCDDILRAFVTNKYPDCQPVFLSGSFSLSHYMWFVINAGSVNFVKTDWIYRVEKCALLWLFRILVSSMFVFHYFCIYTGANHIQNNELFAYPIPTLIAAVMYVINASGMLLVIMLYRPMKFRALVSGGS